MPELSFAASAGEGTLLAYGSGEEAFDEFLATYPREDNLDVTLIVGPYDETGE